MKKIFIAFLCIVNFAFSQSTVTPAKNGGTGLSTYTIGQIIYASGATAFSRLDIGSGGQVLSISGGVPTWTTLAAAPTPLVFIKPLSVTSGTVSIPKATASDSGYLSKQDWATFNAKQTALSGTGYVYQSGSTTSYTNSIPNTSLANSTFTVNGTGMALGTSSTVTAAAGTLTGSALNSGVTTSSLTTLGTVTSGTYNATIGTASVTLGSDATGDIYYRAAGGALTRLAAGGDGTWLRFAGAGAAPTVSTLSITNTATATHIPFATATNTWGESSTLTYSTSTGLIVSNTGSSGNIFSKNGSTNLVTIGSPTSNPTLGMIWMGQASPSVTNYNLFGSGGDLYANGSTNIVFRIATIQQMAIGSGFVSFSTSVKTSGATADWTFTAGAHTAQTASADVNAMQFDFATNNVQHATGALTQNNDFLIKARTHRFVAASTLSDAFTQYINGAPIAGTNATITRRWGLGVVGNAQFQNSVYIGGATTAPVRTLDVSGDIGLTTAGNGIYIKEGTNATMGTATLTAGTVVVSTTKVTASSRIFLTTNGGTLTNIGALYVSARSAGTSFTISSANILDASNVAWIILEPN